MNGTLGIPTTTHLRCHLRYSRLRRLRYCRRGKRDVAAVADRHGQHVCNTQLRAQALREPHQRIFARHWERLFELDNEAAALGIGLLHWHEPATATCVCVCVRT